LEGKIISSGYFNESSIETEKHAFGRKASLRIRNKDNKTPSGSYAVSDFGISCSGTVKLYYENAADGDELIISYDDMINSAMTVNPVRNTFGYSDRFILKKGSGVISGTMARGFRYVMVDLTGKGTVKKIDVLKEEYPYQSVKSFMASDPYLNTLFDQSVRTQQICTIDGFTDCVTRERVLWLGDAYMDCLGNYYSEPDKGLLLDTIYKHAHSQRENGSLGGYTMTDLSPEWICMVSYDMMWLHMVMDYVLFTGDVKSLTPLNETIINLLGYLNAQKNENGVIDTALGGSGFWEWGFSELEGQLLMSNAYFIFTIERMYRDSYFSQFISTDLYEETKILKEKCRTLFYDEKPGLYKDAIRPDGSRYSLHSQTANAFTLLSGICEKEKQKELVERLMNHEKFGVMATGERPQDTEKIKHDLFKINPVSSMYSAMFVCQSLFANGFHEEALMVMKEVWGPFESLPTLPELRVNGSNNTMCHGWSGAPAFLLPMYILGLHPIEKGWEKTLFMPPVLSVDWLSCVKGTVKTPFGEIKAQWIRFDGGIKMAVTIPDEVTVITKWKNKEHSCSKAGEFTFFIFD
ncbi:MAG: hypothetical protein JXQ23_06230, partial [Clostridia bacterium]|nr:hypothetical protein [Clostridia bacterium]